MLDGAEFGKEIVDLVRGYVEREIAPLKIENADLKARIAALEDRPAPEKGEKGEPGDRGQDGRDGTNGTDGRDGKDAPGFSDVLKDDGELVIVLQDGTVRRTGIRDGAPGQPGRDGFDLRKFDTKIDEDGRTLTLVFEDDQMEYRHEMRFAVPLYRGVWTEGEYASGDCVTWGGSVWIAQRDTTDKPDAAESGWKLAVKKGRDGKDAKNG